MMTFRSGALQRNLQRIGEALLVVAACFVALFTVGATLRTALGLPGIVLADALFVALPAWWWARQRDLDLALGTRRDLSRLVAGAALAGIGAFYLMSLVEQELLERVFPTPPELVEAMKRLLDPSGGPTALAARVLALAIAPALAEELLFRGAVVAALGGGWLSVVVSAILFGAFHGSPWRFLPAAGLGLVLGFVRVRSRSLWPPIAFHVVNNVAVISLFAAGRDRPWPLMSLLGAALAIAALVAFGIGLRLCRAT
jgi:membrane protease YdiL (CAAX protease family)